jgi:hypothetical protein
MSTKSMINHGKVQHVSNATAVEKCIFLQEQVGAGESASAMAVTALPLFAPRVHFFACSNPHSVAMLRNIC